MFVFSPILVTVVKYADLTVKSNGLLMWHATCNAMLNLMENDTWHVYINIFSFFPFSFFLFFHFLFLFKNNFEENFKNYFIEKWLDLTGGDQNGTICNFCDFIKKF